MSKRVRDPQLELRWRKLLHQQRASGISVRRFCQRHNLSEPSFYAWRSTIARRQDTPPMINSAGDDALKRHFIPLVMTPTVPAAAVELHLAGGVLRMPAEMPASRLAELVKAILASTAEASR